jgi:hypothetical protein
LAVARWNEVWLCVANSDKNPWLWTTCDNTPQHSHFPNIMLTVLYIIQFSRTSLDH